MKTTCWKCGKEIEGARAIGIWPVCPECEQLEVLKSMADASKGVSGTGSSGSSGDIPLMRAIGQSVCSALGIHDLDSIAFKVEAKQDLQPQWFKDATYDGKSVSASLLCFFLGFTGAHWLFLKKWQPLAYLLMTLAVLTFGMSSILNILFFPLALWYFVVDADEFRRSCSKQEFMDNFKAKLCEYNIAKYGVQIPVVAPLSFADCVLTADDIGRSSIVLDGRGRMYCFEPEIRSYKGVENGMGISWQEWYLRQLMYKFPELIEECMCAVKKIHDSEAFFEWEKEDAI